MSYFAPFKALLDLIYVMLGFVSLTHTHTHTNMETIFNQRVAVAPEQSRDAAAEC